MNFRIKLCSIKTKEIAFLAYKLGYHSIGFNFYKKSKRYIKINQAKKIIDALGPFIIKVGVFVNEDIDKVKKIVKYLNLDLVQLHGDETTTYCRELKKIAIKAIRVHNDFDIKELEKYKFVRAILLDTYKEKYYGGTGERFNWEIIKEAKKINKIILAGGIGEENIIEALKTGADAVDINSKVESSPGIKSKNKIISLMKKINTYFNKRR